MYLSRQCINRWSTRSKVVPVIMCLAGAMLLGTSVSNAFAKSVSRQVDQDNAAFDVRPARAALRRLVGNNYADQVGFEAVPKPHHEDYFQITKNDGHLIINGTSPATLLAGFGWYLEHVVHANISLNGEQLDLPTSLPMPKQAIVRKANVANRFALNDVDEGYTQPYAGWGYWQHKIDVLALHGINEVLLYQGQAKVYEQTFHDFGYTRSYLLHWIPRAAHQPWWLLQNLCCSPDPISQNVIDQRAELGTKIANRLRQLGMVPVFPGYYGTVPPGFKNKNRRAHTVPTGTWGGGYRRPDWLDPTNRLFPEVAADFYRKQAILFGNSSMYKMDPLHEGSEGGVKGHINLIAAARAIQTALNKAHPDATWVLLGWDKNPLSAVIRGLDKSHALIVDGESDSSAPPTDRGAQWHDTPYAFGTIWNFGGHTNMGAKLSVWNTRYWHWKDKKNSTMSGIAMMPEASDNNPAAVAFFTEMAWRKEPAKLDKWFKSWAWHRYGGSKPDPHAVAAWHILQQTAYHLPATCNTKYQTGLYELSPSLSAHAAPLHYNPVKIDQALAQLLKVAPALRHSSAYRYDLTDLTRQALSDRSRVLLPRIKAAFEAKNKAQFNRLSGRWLYLMKELDTVLRTNKKFMLGPWLANAKTYAYSPSEWVRIDYDARSLITIWGTPDIADYARREWQGLVGDYYYSRWKLYFGLLDRELRTGKKQKKVDWNAFGRKWAHEQNTYPTQPHGDIHALATRVLYDLYCIPCIGRPDSRSAGSGRDK